MLGIFRADAPTDPTDTATDSTPPPRRKGFRQQAADAEAAIRDAQELVQAATTAFLGISLVSLVALFLAGVALHKASSK